MPVVSRFRAKRPRIAAAALVMVLVASGCGGSTDAETEAANAAAMTAAEENAAALATTGELDTSELLEVATGDVVTLGDFVDGERPLLAWFWAPH